MTSTVVRAETSRHGPDKSSSPAAESREGSSGIRLAADLAARPLADSFRDSAQTFRKGVRVDPKQHLGAVPEHVGDGA